jgi:hypothetical protein
MSYGMTMAAHMAYKWDPNCNRGPVFVRDIS